MFGTSYTGGNPLKAQQPAQGIMLQGDYGDSKSFKIECDCNSDDHSVYMWIEVQRDQDVPDVEVSFYVTTWTREFWSDWSSRLRAVYEILVKGVHKQEHHMLLNKQSAVNFAHAILDNVKEMEKQNGNTTKRSK
jgi:hypothetical protein